MGCSRRKRWKEEAAADEVDCNTCSRRARRRFVRRKIFRFFAFVGLLVMTAVVSYRHGPKIVGFVKMAKVAREMDLSWEQRRELKDTMFSMYRNVRGQRGEFKKMKQEFYRLMGKENLTQKELDAFLMKSTTQMQKLVLAQSAYLMRARNTLTPFQRSVLLVRLQQMERKRQRRWRRWKRWNRRRAHARHWYHDGHRENAVQGWEAIHSPQQNQAYQAPKTRKSKALGPKAQKQTTVPKTQPQPGQPTVKPMPKAKVRAAAKPAPSTNQAHPKVEPTQALTPSTSSKERQTVPRLEPFAPEVPKTEGRAF